MKELLLPKSQLDVWITAMKDTFRVLGPVKQAVGPPAFKPLANGDEVLLNNDQFTQPPKEAIIPRCEKLFTFQPTADGPHLESAVPTPEKTVLLGLHPCDLRSLHVLDKVYLEGRYTDPYYQARRESILTVVSVCEKKRWSCFCSSVGDPIEWTQAADVAVTDVGEHYYVQAMTEAGEGLISSAGFQEVGDTQRAERDRIWVALQEADQKFDTEKAAHMVNWDSPEWEAIAAKCLGCGTCSFLCPTCTCFDIQDEPLPGGGVERFRVRDTCQFCDFTHMGHGHNPRTGGKERTRQRISHKFDYILKQCGILGCVGCGRCVELCPVNSDLRKVLADMLISYERESVST